MTNSNQLPQPKTYGPLGSLPVIDKDKPLQSYMKLARELGPIFQFQFPGRISTFVSSASLAEEICDETRFDKKVGPALQKVRAFGGDGLFTSETTENNWKKAHNILLPSFSQQAMKGYHAKMIDLATQLIQKWDRLNPADEIDVPEDMTRLTLDTIGLCGFNYRFNSFYRENAHPFVDSMVRAMDEAMSQTQRLGVQDKLMVKSKKQFKEDIQYMFNLVDELIAKRKQNGDQGEDDLLSHMLKGTDPETGEALDDENIRYQIITFLIAGHETTSGLLSFTLYFLMNNPEKLKKAQQEVDEVLGDDVPDYKQVKKLKYIRMVLNEALRLWPTAPAFSVYAKEDTTLNGQYKVNKDDVFTLIIPELHRDPSVWGDDVESFIPERFEDPSSIPYHAYKPFGNGQRACIGQQFALHEATLVLGMVLQHFDLIDHKEYQLEVKETLTLKPDGLTMRVSPRKPVVSFTAASSEEVKSEKKAAQASLESTHGTPLYILFGSNMGTAEGIARDLAETGRQQGFIAEVAPLNDYTSGLPTEGAVLIVSASYNGNPPDNADAFVSWLSETEEGTLNDVRYAVFGCGDHNWATTYQRIPTFIDEQMEQKGAHRLSNTGHGDASDDFEGDYEKWSEALWPNLAKELNIELHPNGEESSSITMNFVSDVSDTPLARTHHAFTSVVSRNIELQHVESGRNTRHLELTLPEGVDYQEGDHIGVLPRNPSSLVERVLSRFNLNGQDYVQLTGDPGKAVHLPTENPVNLKELLSNYVEFQEPATRSQIRALASHTVCPPHVLELEELLEDGTYKREILSKRITMLDLVEKYLACEIPFEGFLLLLPALKARYYSISSSPLYKEGEASITVSVVRGEAWSGNGEYKGIASNYLAERSEGDKIACFISTPQSNFQLPDATETPIVMIGPGTGIAPFRGFIQARRILKEKGETLGAAHLYFGCRNPEHDFLYQAELEKAEQDGIVTLHTAFSRCPGKEKTYVQHRLAESAEDILPLLKDGGRLYICGDGGKMAPDVERTLVECYMHFYQTTKEEADAWLGSLEEDGRYAKDVWAGA
ncbi:bifunctional cytochrome P450/NADPH--P450 reductase [Rossellomorea yichunensis]|uniref:bifunctional cytochrome P450/NADPH--P450 reductase n=1 Tax=Rossellomorea yichunensis TaxID=3077331 RepID=UPI0028DFACF5|nr:bifunctional cytochrome P450/NADPH--P450 reductase [Rossellomorea sp. YC4-1]MDT9027134.1 bifunctional cytochrome P450/NADPH--P450 reductase [Rossellomorea sp. YC4-1]